MKVMAILSRVIFSIILVLLLAGYQQVSSTISLVDFLAWFDAAALTHALSGINTVTISLVVILLLGIFSFTRILEAVWNVIFCASIIALLFFGSYSLLGPGIALPHAISNSEVIKQVCDALRHSGPHAYYTGGHTALPRSAARPLGSCRRGRDRGL